MELRLLSVMLRSRESFYLILKHLNQKLYTREFILVVGFVKSYYDRDDTAQEVDLELLHQLIRTVTVNEKHADKFVNLVDEGYATDTSEANVMQVVLSMKQRQMGQELAQAIANEKEHTELLGQYTEVLKYSKLEDLTEKGVEVFDGDDVDDLIEHVVNPINKIRVYPLSLSDKLDGGLEGSDSVVIFGRPEMAKTALILTMSCGFANQGHRGIVFNNEERIERLRLRAFCNASGMTVNEVRADPEEAKRRAKERGFYNIVFVALSPGVPEQIEAFVERYEAKWFVVDQLRNLAMKSENRTNQLEAAQTAIRNIGKKHNAITISVTQAGDSAEGKSVLDMGDVDNSNTGIPGACDVLLGIGANAEQKENGIRVLSLIKNKVGGIHDAVPVRFNQWLSKYASIKQE